MSLQLQYNFSSTYLAGNVIKNTVSNSNLNCTLYNNPSINQESAPNNTNKSIYFNGSSQQYGLVTPFTTPSSSESSGMTFSTWVKATNQNTTSSRGPRIFIFGNGDDISDQIALYITSGNIGLSIRNPNKEGISYEPTPLSIVNSIFNNTWYHFTWTISWQYGWNFYINGNKVYSDKDAWYPRNISRSKNYIGKGTRTDDPPFWGNICDFRYYNTVLTDVQVQGVYYGLTIFIGEFAYQGCYHDNLPRAISTQVQNVSSPEQCQQFAINNNAQVFGVQDGGQCFIGNSLSSAQKYGPYAGAYVYNNGNCGRLGIGGNQQVYYSGTSTEPGSPVSPASPASPPPPIPSLGQPNFSTEYFKNNNTKNINNNIFLIFIFALILILLIFFIIAR